MLKKLSIKILNAFTLLLLLDIFFTAIDLVLIFGFNTGGFLVLRSLISTMLALFTILSCAVVSIFSGFPFAPILLGINIASVKIIWLTSCFNPTASQPGAELIANLFFVIGAILFCWGLKRNNTNESTFISTGSTTKIKFSFKHSIKVLGFFLILVTPLQLLAAGVIAGFRLSETTHGFVFARPDGLYAMEKTYKKEDMELQLTGMVHIASADFYKGVQKDIAGNKVLLLMEGVSDKKKLITNPPDYAAISDSIGLDNQKEQFEIDDSHSNVTKLNADVDVSDFAPSTIKVLNLIGQAKNKDGFDLEKFIELNIMASKPAVALTLFNDILTKRNHKVISLIEDNADKYSRIIVPWGAFHLPEIQTWALANGFQISSQKQRRVFSFKTVLKSIFKKKDKQKIITEIENEKSGPETEIVEEEKL